MIKQGFAIIFFFTILFSATVVYAMETNVQIDGLWLDFPDQKPVIVGPLYGKRALVPVREVFEALGFTVQWEDETKTVVLSRGTDTLRITIGERTFTRNGEVLPLDIHARLIGGRTMVPLNQTLESVGIEVYRDIGRNVMMINTPWGASSDEALHSLRFRHFMLHFSNDIKIENSINFSPLNRHYGTIIEIPIGTTMTITPDFVHEADPFSKLGLWITSEDFLIPKISPADFTTHIYVFNRVAPYGLFTLVMDTDEVPATGTVYIRVVAPRDTRQPSRFDENGHPEYIIIQGIEFDTSLTTLDLSHFARFGDSVLVDEDIIPLRYMTNLTELNLYCNHITDISPLAGLTNLRILNIGGDHFIRNKISDLTPIVGLTNLTYLNLSANPISDFSAISRLTNLEELYIIALISHLDSRQYILRHLLPF